MLGSIVLGARVLSSYDDTVAVWQVVRDVPAGTPIGAEDVRVTRVHFDEAGVARQYLLASQPLAAGSVASRDLSAEELLAASSITTTRATTRELPLGVAGSDAPPDLHAGDRVDVWAVPTQTTGRSTGAPPPTLVLHDVAVLTVTGSADGSGDRLVLVELGSGVSVGAALQRTVGAEVVLVRLAG